MIASEQSIADADYIFAVLIGDNPYDARQESTIPIFASPATISMDAYSTTSGREYIATIQQLSELTTLRALVEKIKGADGIVSRNERRSTLEGRDVPVLTRLFKKRRGIPADAIITLPPNAIDLILEVEFGPN